MTKFSAMLLSLSLAMSTASSVQMSFASPNNFAELRNAARTGTTGRPVLIAQVVRRQLPANPTYRAASTGNTRAAGFAGKWRNGLPPAELDSFVYEAGGNAELIYGDEGDGCASCGSLPPYNSFTAQHRIEAGIHGTRREGLRTGHDSCLPKAWGADEFLAPPGEWCHSGQAAGGSCGAGGGCPYEHPNDPGNPGFDPGPGTDPGFGGDPPPIGGGNAMMASPRYFNSGTPVRLYQTMPRQTSSSRFRAGQ